ncbi:unnamed protein product [Hyaloperonospora brassicae]|uniref:Uncharacterized protein n=1 Tax=Hyaloperonospora brassicae TaxID=162125 RepID=A0AAV0TET6_HYABA|nr:unnamed protein product [Hyaloperonospora brassicae]
MKTCDVLNGALLAATAFLAQGEPWKTKLIGLKQVEPFPEPEATTIGDKAGVKFKPQIHVSAGCPSYPAVNAAGETTYGDWIEETADVKCEELKVKSQVYGRSTWHLEKFAVMYTWHFPTSPNYTERYDWEHVVVWLNNPAVANPTLEAVSIWSEGKKAYIKAAPPDAKFMDGSSVKLDIGVDGQARKLSLSPLAGQFQPLIMWDQMPNDTRSALDATKWYGLFIPLSDSRLTLALDNAWPFAPVAPPPLLISTSPKQPPSSD